MFVQLSEIFLLLCGLSLSLPSFSRISFHDSRILSLLFMCISCDLLSVPFLDPGLQNCVLGISLLLGSSFFGAKIGMQLNCFCFVGLFPAAPQNGI